MEHGLGEHGAGEHGIGHATSQGRILNQHHALETME